MESMPAWADVKKLFKAQARSICGKLDDEEEEAELSKIIKIKYIIERQHRYAVGDFFKPRIWLGTNALRWRIWIHEVRMFQFELL